jgi:sucrose phosphorylase
MHPDSIGEKFSDTIDMLKMTEFKVFFFVIRVAYFFNSDLERFSIIDYDINKDLVGTKI